MPLAAMYRAWLVAAAAPALARESDIAAGGGGGACKADYADAQSLLQLVSRRGDDGCIDVNVEYLSNKSRADVESLLETVAHKVLATLHVETACVNRSTLKGLKRIRGVNVEEAAEVSAAVHHMGAAVKTREESTPYGITMVKAEQVPAPPTTDLITVCVVDTGYALGHEDLPSDNVGGEHNYGEYWDQDGHGHGSHCAGTIGAIGGNGKGVIGVFDDPTRFNFFIGKGLTDSGSGSTTGVLAAVEHCVDNGAKVISMSLGGGGPSTVSEDAYELAYNNGVLIVAAAGNSGNTAYSYPASYKHVMSVAAVDSNRAKAGFSQWNSQVEIAAPGVGVLSTLPGNNYAAWSGTSMACPHVAGVAALVWSHFTECTNQQIRNVLLLSAAPPPAWAENENCTNEYGYGIVDAKAAYDLLSEQGCAAGNVTDEALGGCAQLTGPAPPPPPCTARNLTIIINTDNYGSETSWELIGGSAPVTGSGYGSNSAYTEVACLGEGSYTFTISDSYGDGICCSEGDGSYMLVLDGATIREGGDFGDSEVTQIPAAGPTTTPIPTPPPTMPGTPAPTPPTLPPC